MGSAIVDGHHHASLHFPCRNGHLRTERQCPVGRGHRRRIERFAAGGCIPGEFFSVQLAFPQSAGSVAPARETAAINTIVKHEIRCATERNIADLPDGLAAGLMIAHRLFLSRQAAAR